MSLHKRLHRLERAGIVPCSECGQLARDNEIDIRVRTADEGPEEPEGIHYCPSCGRMTRAVIKLTWN